MPEWDGAKNKDVLRDSRLLGMIFGRKMQNLSMYKHNNTGEDITQEINPLIYADLFKVKNVHEESDFFTPPNQTTPDVDQTRYLFNNAHLFSVNHLYKPSQPVDLRVQMNALHDKITSRNSSATSYFYPGQLVTVREEEESATNHNQIQGELMFQLNDTSLFIRNTLSGATELEKKMYDLLTNEERVRQQLRPERKNIRNSFELIRKHNRYAYSVYSDNSYFDLPQYMTVTPGLYAGLLNENESYSSFRQLARLRSLQSHTYSYFQHKVAGFYLKYNVGLLHARQRMTSDIELTTQSQTRPAMNDEFHNNLSFSQTRFYLEPTFNYKDYKFDIQLRVPLTLYLAELKSVSPASTPARSRRLSPSPSLNIKYNIDAYWTISGGSSYSHIYTDIRQLYAGYVFTSYRNTSANIPELDINTLLSNTLYARFNNPFSGLFVSVNGFYNVNRNDVMRIYRNNDILSWSETIYRPHKNRHWGMGSRLSKTFAWWKFFGAVSANYSRRANKQLLEDAAVASVIQSVNIALDFSIQPNRYINAQAESHISGIRSELDYPGYSTRNTIHYTHRVSASVIPDDHWRITWDHAISHNKEKENRLTYFTDLSCSYIYKKVEFQLSGRNLFNNNAFERTYISNFTETSIHYTLRPMEIVAKVLFTF